MKYFCISLILIIWMIITLILAISIIGGVILFMADEDSEWLKIPDNLIELLKK